MLLIHNWLGRLRRISAYGFACTGHPNAAADAEAPVPYLGVPVSRRTDLPAPDTPVLLQIYLHLHQYHTSLRALGAYLLRPTTDATVRVLWA